MLDMSEAYFNVQDGYKVLEATGKGAGASIKLLNIEDFFNVSQNVSFDFFSNTVLGAY